MTEKKIKILVADDHELFRKGLISLLRDEETIHILAEANDGKDLIYKYLKYKPDVVLSDISMPGLSGLEAVATLINTDPKVKVIFLSMLSGEEYVYHCYNAGGLGLINKDIPKEELIEAITSVYNGQKYFGKDYSEEKLYELALQYQKQENEKVEIKDVEFTEQEIDVLLLVAEGLTSSDIGEKLYISKRTVDSHRSNILHKLNLQTGPQLLKYAIGFADIYKKKKPKL